MKNRNRNHKKDAKWPHGRPPGWEVHHIDRNPKNGGGNTICLPREVHIDLDRKNNIRRDKGPLSASPVSRQHCERAYKEWIRKTGWTGMDPNNGDWYDTGRFVQNGRLF